MKIDVTRPGKEELESRGVFEWPIWEKEIFPYIGTEDETVIKREEIEFGFLLEVCPQAMVV